MDLRGKFIVIDGPDGSGKGTQIARLAAWLREIGCHVTQPRDPGGTVIGDRIRQVLLGYDLTHMDATCETLLFMASRAQLAAEVIRPALAAGKTVLCDRFISSTCAYQTAAGYELQRVLELGRYAVGDTWPDLTLVLDVPPEVGLARTQRRQTDAANGAPCAAATEDPTQPDAMEQRPLAFHERVRDNFRQLPDHYPRPVRIVDATGTPDAVFAELQRVLRDAFE